MKKNILHFYLLAVVLFAASAFTACSNNDEQANVLPVNTYTITVNATKGDDVSSAPSNRALSIVGTTLTATWTKDDVVAVYKSESNLGNLKAQSDGASTTLSGTLTGSVSAGDELTLKFLSPNYTSQDGTLDYIAANCDYATATVNVSAINGNNITTTPASFANQQAIVKFSLLKGTSPLSASPLVVTVDGTSYTVTPASATDVLYVAIPGFSSKNVALAATVGSDTYTYAKTGVTFDNGKYYTVSVKMSLVKTLANATIDDIGKIVDADGKLYNTADEATSPAAMIAYISSKGHGLAIACADQSATQTFNGGTLAVKPADVEGGTWKMPTREDWEHIFTGCGCTQSNYWNISKLKNKLEDCSAVALSNAYYWTGTPNGNYYGYCVIISSNSTSAEFQYAEKGDGLQVRAVLEF